jgi:tetratricopeptide (TPR) repeat protein
MFEESFLFNLAVFAAGQLVAYLYLRTGRPQRGLTLMVGCWILADVVLLEKFAFQRTDLLFSGALLALQCWSLLEVAVYTYGRWHRRRRKTREQRAKGFRSGYDSYLRDDLPAAIAAFRRLVRLDPWDLQARLALGTALARAGQQRRARAAFRAARSLDVRGEYRDAIGDELARFRGARPVPAVGADRAV